MPAGSSEGLTKRYGDHRAGRYRPRGTGRDRPRAARPERSRPDEHRDL